MALIILNDVVDDVESKQKNNNYVIIASLKKTDIRVFCYQVYQAWLRERMLNRLARLAMSTSVLKAVPGKLDFKRHQPGI